MSIKNVSSSTIMPATTAERKRAADNSGANQQNKRLRTDTNGSDGRQYLVISPTTGQFNPSGNGLSSNNPIDVGIVQQQWPMALASSTTLTLPTHPTNAPEPDQYRRFNWDSFPNVEPFSSAACPAGPVFAKFFPPSPLYHDEVLGTSHSNSVPFTAAERDSSFPVNFSTASTISTRSTTALQQSNQSTPPDEVPLSDDYFTFHWSEKAVDDLVQNLFINTGNYLAGIDNLKHDYVRDQNDAKINYWLGYFHMKLGDHLMADFHLNKITEEHELYFKAQDAIAHSYLKQKEFDKAICCWEKVLIIKKGSDPTSINAVRYHLGECYIIKKQYYNAYERLRKISKNDPLHDQAQALMKRYRKEIKQNKKDLGFGRLTTKNPLGGKNNGNRDPLPFQWNFHY